MTKADIVERVSEKIGTTRKDAQDLVEAVFDLLKDTLESGEDVKISGFGKFEARQKNDRRGRNPQTGEAITIAARKVLTFKLSNILRDSLNKQSC